MFQFNRFLFLFVSFLCCGATISQEAISPPSGLNIELLEEVPASSAHRIESCHEPWDSAEVMNLDFRVQRLLSNPYRAGFGAKATGGTSTLKIVTNPAASGAGTYADTIANAVSGDFVVFDPSNQVYLNSLNSSQATLPANVTIDGSMPNGKVVTLRSTRADNNNMVGMSNSNNILANIYFDQINEAAAVRVGNGEHYWLHCFRISGTDSSLSIGNQISNLATSADNVTVSRYQVLGESDKGFLILSAGNSCELPNGRFDPQAVGADSTAQRRAHITIIDSELAAATRNILNKGAYVDIVGTYIHGQIENTITRHGGQTAIRCSYIDSRAVRLQSIRVDGGPNKSGESSTAPAQCAQQSETFLDNNLYRQADFEVESANPRINESGSDNTFGDLGHMTDGFENWLSPTSGRPVFERPYGNLDVFCETPRARSLSAQ